MNGLDFKICNNPLKVFFHGGTTITMLDMPEIPMHNFDFKPIVNFLHGDFQVNRLYNNWINLILYFIPQSTFMFIRFTIHLRLTQM